MSARREPPRSDCPAAALTIGLPPPAFPASPAGGEPRTCCERLRGGETIYGKVSVERFRLRAPYGLVEVPRRTLASIQFADIAKGTAKLVLTDGDSLSGLLLDDDVEITAADGKRSVRKEKIEAIGFRFDAEGERARRGTARLQMRNGDSFSGRLRSRSLRLRVANQSLELPFSDVARVEFGEEGKKSQVVTRKGDTPRPVAFELPASIVFSRTSIRSTKRSGWAGRCPRG